MYMYTVQYKRKKTFPSSPDIEDWRVGAPRTYAVAQLFIGLQ